MKLHLPVSLRKSVIACILATAGIFPSISISAASWGIAVCLLGTPSAKAETSTVTISSSGKSELISTPDDSLIIMNLNRGYLYGSSTLNSSFDVAADVRIDSLIISDGFKLNTYNFRGDISGSGTFERTSDAKGANQTYVFTGDMSQYSGDMKFSRENDGNTFKFIGNQSGTGHITIAAGNSIAVDGAVMNNSSITSAGTFTVSGNSSFAGDVSSTGTLSVSGSASFAGDVSSTGTLSVSGSASFAGDVSSTGTLSVSGSASFAGDVSSTGTLNVNGSASFEGDVYSNGSLVLGADAMLTNKGSFTFGEEATINLVRAVAAEDAQRTLTYTILSSAGTETSNLSSLSLERIVGIQSVGRNWSFNDDGTLVGVLNNHALSYAGENLTWNTTSATFSNGSETVAFSNGDDVTFSGISTVTLGATLQAQRVTVANGAKVSLTFQDNASLSVAEAVVNGTLELLKGGQNGVFSGNVDVYGKLHIKAGDVTGWSSTNGIKSIDIFAGGEMYVGVSNNQTGAGLAINLQGGSISGVSGSNFDLGYGGAIYGYSSLSALAADTATAETPTVSTISGTNLTLRQYHTTISVAENARLDILSGILVKDNKSDLNGEGAVPSHLLAGLVKTGAGELRLSGNNTYTQATTVAEGTLTLADSASLVSASVSLISGTTFKLDTSSVSGITCSGAVNGSGSIVKTGAGNATIGTIGSSFTGEIDVQMGTLSVQSFDFEQTKSVFIHSGATLDLNLAQGASYHLQTPIGGAGMLQKSGSGSLDISDLPDSFTGGISLQGGTLKVGDSLLVSNNFDFAVGTNDAVLLGSLTLGDGTLWLNASGSGAATSLKGSDLTLLGGTHLQLSGGNGGVYDLFSGITALRDKDGNIISLDSTNNAAANYFDINCPGSSFWADSTLQLTSEGTLQLVRHNEPVKNTLSVTSRLSSAADYRYYSSITFKDLDYSLQGGAVYVASSSTVTLSNNGSLSFSGNTAHHGGALMVYGNITVRENGSVSFIGNSATEGGAVWGYGNIVLSDNGSLSFRGNTAHHGGALMVYGNISVRENGSVSFSGNSASYGGTVYVASSGVITLSNNGRVSFSSNSAFFGGALDVCGNITLSGNGHVSFDANSASYSGGAIYGGDHSNITLCDNGIISFYGNSASESGGAIKACLSSTIMLSNNDSVSFVDNSASSSGGAISAESSSSLTLSNNKSVSFIGNSASDFFGGAIIGVGNITLRENDSVIFIGNSASSGGGAIYTGGNLSIRNNDSVEFYQNVEVEDGSYRLRSVYAGGSGDVISLSAAAGKNITFRDSIYIGSGNSFKLNEAYEGTAQQGDIIFTGATTVDDLQTVKGNVAGTAEEIRLSRTTEVNTLTELYGGRLRVEEGSIYQGRGITVMEGSAATVRVQNATLSHSGYDLTFNAGTTLELAGANSISGNLNLLDGSTLHIDFAGNEFTTNLDGSPLALTGDAFLRLTGAGNGDGKTYTLLTGVSGLLDAQGNAITLDDTNNAISNYFDSTRPGSGFWKEATLQFVDGSLQLVLHEGEVITSADSDGVTRITTRQSYGVNYQYYAGVRFENIAYDSSSSASGGAIYGTSSSTITLSDNGSVTFDGNTASGEDNAYGGAIYGYAPITLSDNGSVTFSGNTSTSSSSSASGGAIYGYDPITLSDNGSVTFSGNSVNGATSVYGGAICGDGGLFYDPHTGYWRGGKGDISLTGNSSVTFSGNTSTSSSSSAYGGAIYGASSSTITLSDNGSVTFSGNTASSGSGYAFGGAIYGYDPITLSDNGSVTFSGNTSTSSSSSAYGGAIYGYDPITLSDNGSVTFSGNTASSGSGYASGGAISGDTITLSNNGRVTFSGNTASGVSSAYGGAISGDTITLSNNGNVTFNGNSASSMGGAIYGGSSSPITLSNNGSVTFSGNTASSYGGAIYGASSSTITLSDNGSVTFSGNTASSGSGYAYGGAISGEWDSTITLSDNGSVEFSENTATSSSSSASGGAIRTYGNLSIQNNDSVLFYQNAEVKNGSYRLRSIYAGGSGDVISLSAAEGKSIEFQDSIYIDRGRTFNLNADYTDAENKVHQQHGDILFTGKYTEAHLNALMAAAEADRTATAEEILSSRTTEVCAMTNLYGGRLRVEDGAIYKGYGITAHTGSDSTVLVKDAELNHNGYDLSFHAGTTLELAGNNTIIGDVQMLEGSTLLLNAQEIPGKSEIFGDLNHSSGVTLSLKNDGYQGYENKILLYVAGDFSDWDTEAFTVTGADNAAVSRVGNFLILNYNAESFNRYYNGEQSYETTQTACLHFHFGSICFDGITGGAISGEETVMLCDNGSLTFHGNSATGSGGAIYGSSITLSKNESVGFEGNVATRRGGAIAGSSLLTALTTINENDSVTFIGNRVESETSGADGGAIYCINNEVNHNKKVSFKDNVASSTVNWAAGGAIRGSASISGNDEVRITGNKAQTGAVSSQGGALFGWEYQLNDNGVLEFFGNSAIAASADGSNAVALGGAIYAFQVYGGTPEYRELSICNNGDTLFQQNSEVRDGVYRLRSIYTEDAGNGAVALSAAAGKRIEFRDSIYIGTGNTLSLNADYTDAEEKVHEQQGDIIFTGATTVNDLYIVKGNVDGTEEEIQASRTSEVHGAVNLYGGRLRVEEQAVLKTTAGLAVAEDSNATVKIDNAELDAGTCDIAIGATGRLELSNGAIVRANEIIIDDEATLALSCSELQTRATFTLREAVAAGTTAYNTGNTVVIDGDLTLNGGATLVADNAHFIMTEGSVLTFNASDEKKINLALTLGTVYEPDVPITLFSDIENLRFIYNGTELTDSATANPGDFFTGAWINDSTTFTYDAEAGTFFVMNVNSLSIPEPTTTTLGLLALAGLAARRRRLD